MNKKIIKGKFKIKKDLSGVLSFLEKKKEIKEIKRIFFVKVKKKTTRGNHAHKKCTQILFCLNGCLDLEIFNGNKWCTIRLVEFRDYIIVPPLNFVKIHYKKKGTILGVLCNRYYDKNDYIYNIKYK
jgi:dTDP-4-dehydrorhamnose 3,5-epimerase-like enzyme